jgi:hypothetical protein
MHSRAIEAVAAYLQMPYAIRRRRHEPESASAERVRLAEAFTAVQTDLACAEALMRTDRDPAVREGYANLVAVLRQDAGGEASRAWDLPPITRDDQMGMGDVHAALANVREEQQRFEQVAARSTEPRWRLGSALTKQRMFRPRRPEPLLTLVDRVSKR